MEQESRGAQAAAGGGHGDNTGARRVLSAQDEGHEPVGALRPTRVFGAVRALNAPEVLKTLNAPGVLVAHELVQGGDVNTRWQIRCQIGRGRAAGEEDNGLNAGLGQQVGRLNGLNGLARALLALAGRAGAESTGAGPARSNLYETGTGAGAHDLREPPRRPAVGRPGVTAVGWRPAGKRPAATAAGKRPAAKRPGSALSFGLGLGSGPAPGQAPGRLLTPGSLKLEEDAHAGRQDLPSGTGLVAYAGVLDLTCLTTDLIALFGPVVLPGAITRGAGTGERHPLPQTRSPPRV